MYFQVTIVNGNQFTIEETHQKRVPRGLALFTLRQIQRVFENQMRYCQIESDRYSNLPLSHVYCHLQKQAKAIHARFIEKASRASFCFQKQARLEQAQVRKVFFQIERKQSLPLPEEVVRKMLEYLTIKELFVFSQVNHQARREAGAIFPLRAREFGATSKKEEGPRQFAICLRKEVLSLQEKGFIPEDYLSDHWETILTKLKSISSEEIFAIFSHPAIYLEKCPFFIRYLLKNTARTPSCDELRTLGSTGLIFSILCDQREVGELLLYHGAFPDGRDGVGDTPLIVAARKGKEKIVRFLLKRSADPDAADANGNTPLHWAASLGLDKIIDLLLQWKANPHLLNRNGKDPLFLGSEYPLVKSHLERALVGVAK